MYIKFDFYPRLSHDVLLTTNFDLTFLFPLKASPTKLESLAEDNKRDSTFSDVSNSSLDKSLGSAEEKPQTGGGSLRIQREDHKEEGEARAAPIMYVLVCGRKFD